MARSFSTICRVLGAQRVRGVELRTRGDPFSGGRDAPPNEKMRTATRRKRLTSCAFKLILVNDLRVIFRPDGGHFHSMHAASRDATVPHPNLQTLASCPVRAVEFCRPMRGPSHALLMRGDNGRYYVVKHRNLCQHSRVLPNEMLAAQLALIVGLPVTEFAVIEVPMKSIFNFAGTNDQSDLRPHVGLEDGGVHFGSAYPGMPDQTLVVDFLPDHILRREKYLIPAFLGAFVFDLWTYNCNSRQFVFSRPADEEGSPYSAWLIGHGSCFNGCQWNLPDFPTPAIFPRAVYESVRGVASFEPFLSEIEGLTEWQIEKCAQAIPPEWCGGSSEQILQLAEQLWERTRRLRHFVEDAIDARRTYFPNCSPRRANGSAGQYRQSQNAKQGAPARHYKRY